MPLLDHFHPPLSDERRWRGFHSKWANVLVDELNETLLPEGYFAEPQIPAAFVDTFEVHVFNTRAGPRLVAAIELVSPANKDRAETRRAFAVKCASYLAQAISLIVVDVVTNRHANLHDEIVALMPPDAAVPFPGAPRLYASAYQPLRRDG